VSVDLSATISQPFDLDTFVSATQTTLGQLTGTLPPDLVVIAGRTYRQGQLVDPGAEVPRGSATTLGDPDDVSLGEPVSGRGYFVLRLDGLPDEVFFFVYDGRKYRPADPLVANFSPSRTPVGVTVAISATIAAAIEGQGELIDLNIRFLESPVADPRQFVELTKLRPGDKPFRNACLDWVRQFDRLEGWPPE
jgi:hypothetical protein